MAWPSLLTTLRFGLVWFYGISTIVGYLMPNPVYIWLCKHILLITFLNEPKFIFLHSEVVTSIAI